MGDERNDLNIDNLVTFKEKLKECTIDFENLAIAYQFCDDHSLSEEYRKVVFDEFIHSNMLNVKDIIEYFVNYSDYYFIDLKIYMIQNNLVDEFINKIDGKIVRDKDGYMGIGNYNMDDFYEDLSNDYQLGVVL